MSSLWQQDHAVFLPGVEIDSSSVSRSKARGGSHSWMKEEKDAEVIQWKATSPGAGSDTDQDNTPSSAMSTVTGMEGLPPSVMLTITKLQCMVQSKQERIEALERQVEDLQQDRKFLRSQVENLTRARFIPPAEAGRSLFCEPKTHKRQRDVSSNSSPGSETGSDGSLSSDHSAASELRKKKRHKEKRRGKKGKDYSRKRATGVQYVIHRYKQVLSAFNKKKNMSGAFRHHGIDRNTIANTAPIAELHLAAKETTVALVGHFRAREETLVSYAQRCALAIESDPELIRRIEQMKANGELLPIAPKRTRMLSLISPLGEL